MTILCKNSIQGYFKNNLQKIPQSCRVQCIVVNLTLADTGTFQFIVGCQNITSISVYSTAMPILAYN